MIPRLIRRPQMDSPNCMWELFSLQLEPTARKAADVVLGLRRASCSLMKEPVSP